MPAVAAWLLFLCDAKREFLLAPLRFWQFGALGGDILGFWASSLSLSDSRDSHTSVSKDSLNFGKFLQNSSILFSSTFIAIKVVVFTKSSYLNRKVV